jgi:hypothetical protein
MPPISTLPVSQNRSITDAVLRPTVTPSGDTTAPVSHDHALSGTLGETFAGACPAS